MSYLHLKILYDWLNHLFLLNMILIGKRNATYLQPNNDQRTLMYKF